MVRVMDDMIPNGELVISLPGCTKTELAGYANRLKATYRMVTVCLNFKSRQLTIRS